MFPFRAEPTRLVHSWVHYRESHPLGAVQEEVKGQPHEVGVEHSFKRWLLTTHVGVVVWEPHGTPWEVDQHLLPIGKFDNFTKKLNQVVNVDTKDRPGHTVPLACRGRTAVLSLANTSHMCCLELMLKGVLYTSLECLGLLILFLPVSYTMLTRPNKAQTAVHLPFSCFFIFLQLFSWFFLLL